MGNTPSAPVPYPLPLYPPDTYPPDFCPPTPQPRIYPRRSYPYTYYPPRVQNALANPRWRAYPTRYPFFDDARVVEVDDEGEEVVDGRMGGPSGGGMNGPRGAPGGPGGGTLRRYPNTPYTPYTPSELATYPRAQTAQRTGVQTRGTHNTVPTPGNPDPWLDACTCPGTCKCRRGTQRLQYRTRINGQAVEGVLRVADFNGEEKERRRKRVREKRREEREGVLVEEMRGVREGLEMLPERLGERVRGLFEGEGRGEGDADGDGGGGDEADEGTGRRGMGRGWPRGGMYGDEEFDDFDGGEDAFFGGGRGGMPARMAPRRGMPRQRGPRDFLGDNGFQNDDDSFFANGSPRAGGAGRGGQGQFDEMGFGGPDRMGRMRGGPGRRGFDEADMMRGMGARGSGRRGRRNDPPPGFEDEDDRFRMHGAGRAGGGLAWSESRSDEMPRPRPRRKRTGRGRDDSDDDSEEKAPSKTQKPPKPSPPPVYPNPAPSLIPSPKPQPQPQPQPPRSPSDLASPLFLPNPIHPQEPPQPPPDPNPNPYPYAPHHYPPHAPHPAPKPGQPHNPNFYNPALNPYYTNPPPPPPPNLGPASSTGPAPIPPPHSPPFSPGAARGHPHTSTQRLTVPPGAYPNLHQHRSHPAVLQQHGPDSHGHVSPARSGVVVEGDGAVRGHGYGHGRGYGHGHPNPNPRAPYPDVHNASASEQDGLAYGDDPYADQQQGGRGQAWSPVSPLIGEQGEGKGVRSPREMGDRGGNGRGSGRGSEKGKEQGKAKGDEDGVRDV